MSLTDKIKNHIKEAMKNKEAERLSVLRMLFSSISNKEKEKRAELDEEEVVKIIFSEIRKRKDSIEQYKKGNRDDLADKEQRELEVLKKYLPEQLSEEEIRKIVKEVIRKLNAEGPKDIGRIMKTVMSQVKGKTEGGAVSKIVQNELQ